MRPIKFRAWDDHNKIMIDPYCELRENRFWGEDLTNTGYADPVSVMQFTGMKDKNGKEIYEGDIVHWPHLLSTIPVEVYYNEEEVCFYGRSLSKDIEGESYLDGTCEVIGNIHQPTP